MINNTFIFSLMVVIPVLCIIMLKKFQKEERKWYKEWLKLKMENNKAIMVKIIWRGPYEMEEKIIGRIVPAVYKEGFPNGNYLIDGKYLGRYFLEDHDYYFSEYQVERIDE